MGPDRSTPSPPSELPQRLDKWLWFARLLKSRTSAAQLIEGGKVRVNRIRVVKPSHPVQRGDVLTLVLRGRVLVLKVLAGGKRRGPPPEARLLYEPIEDQAGEATSG
jgi:ribosome-associated heat shock protein Hsp15